LNLPKMRRQQSPVFLAGDLIRQSWVGQFRRTHKKTCLNILTCFNYSPLYLKIIYARDRTISRNFWIKKVVPGKYIVPIWKSRRAWSKYFKFANISIAEETHTVVYRTNLHTILCNYRH
jgi:hypothetical protein